MITCLFAVLTLADRAAAQPCEYEIAHIIEGPPCPQFSTPTPQLQAINDHNEVVGYYTVCNIGNDRAFYWSEATGLVTLQFPFPIFSSRAYDINNDGLICGTHTLTGSNFGPVGFAMKPDGTEYQFLGFLPGGNFSEATAINDAAQVTGYANATGTTTEAFIWQDGVMTGLRAALGQPRSRANDINNDGWVTGWMGSNQFQDAVAFMTDGVRVANLGPVPSGVTGEGNAITSLLTVAGDGLVMSKWGGSLGQGFYWEGAQSVALELHQGSDDCEAKALDTAGAVMGWCDLPAIDQGLIWKDDEVTLLSESVCSEELLEVTLIRDVCSATGMIVGNGRLNGETCGLVFAPTDPTGDVDGDGVVNGSDLGMLLLNWGQAQTELDLNGDGTTDGEDLGILLLNWTQ